MGAHPTHPLRTLVEAKWNGKLYRVSLARVGEDTYRVITAHRARRRTVT